MSEFEQRESALLRFKELKNRIYNIEDYKNISVDDQIIDFREIIKQTSHLDPSILIPIINELIFKIDNVIKQKDQIKDKIRLKLENYRALFGSKEKSKAVNEKNIDNIFGQLKEELENYKSSLSEYEETCEVSGIGRTANNILKLQWEISIQLLSDLFKALELKGYISEGEKGNMVKFAKTHFLVKNSRDTLGQGSVKSEFSGGIKNHQKLLEFLNHMTEFVKKDSQEQ
jgi:hypothetical protein